MTNISDLKKRRKNMVFFLYNSYLYKWNEDDALKEAFEVWNLGEEEIKILQNLYSELSNYEKLAIANITTDWKWERINSLDKALIIYAIHEFKSGMSDFKLSVNEAIELSKEYSDPKSFKLINGILDKIKEVK